MATATKSKVDEKQMLIGGVLAGLLGRQDLREPRSGDGRAASPPFPEGDGQGRRRGGRRCPRRLRVRGVAGAAPGRPRQDALAGRRADRREHGRARRARDARPGQADRGLEGRDPRRRGALPLLRGLGDEDRGRDPASLDPRRLPLHAARADRRLRADHPLELPHQHRELEDRPGARLRQHRGREAGRAGLADDAPARRADPGGGYPGRRLQHRHRRPGGRPGAGQPR